MPVLKNASHFSFATRSGEKVILVGNKIDLDSLREVTAKDGRALADELGYLFAETSAKTGQGVDGVRPLLTTFLQLRDLKCDFDPLQC